MEEAGSSALNVKLAIRTCRKGHAGRLWFHECCAFPSACAPGERLEGHRTRAAEEVLQELDESAFIDTDVNNTCELIVRTHEKHEAVSRVERLIGNDARDLIATRSEDTPDNTFQLNFFSSLALAL
jgi:hypothetical protein